MIFTYYMTVDHVHDGDTIYGVLDMGLGHYMGRPPSPLFGIRFYGINAPELNTDDGKACRDYLMTLVKPGDVLAVQSMHWDKYAMRVDGVPFPVLDPAVNLCEMMLAFGHGVVRYNP